ncbi:MAG: hypothetical protein HYU66_12745 [Armatimonadetes bacterium]|nr:hypothetical protein [Armatimonadota bacterium]
MAGIDSNPFRELIHIPGPNPILRRGGPGEWDEGCLEACDILKERETYYLYYHANPLDTAKWPRSGYRIGVATATSPLGPWTKHPGNPILDLGPEGSWESTHVACAAVHKESVDRYYLFYSGHGGTAWGIGLATGSSPVGPWERLPSNPLLPDFGYVGAVMKVEGKYRLYTEHPIGSTGPDYGPLSLALADWLEGPWTPHPEPVLKPGDWGAWDDGGYSEAKVLYLDGVYHVFYGGAKLNPVRILSQESIGHAWSEDGVTFIKDPLNPVAPRERNPPAAAFAEVHTLFEPPFLYCYHTLRYLNPERPGIEDLGVQILATARPVRVALPLVYRDHLLNGAETSLSDCPSVSLERASTVSVLADCGAGSVELSLWWSVDNRAWQEMRAVGTMTQPVAPYLRVTAKATSRTPAERVRITAVVHVG